MTAEAARSAARSKRRFAFGPGALVAAAFIGPGTVTTATVAGANFGFVLVWTLAIATGATIILQDMAARLGAGARLGLGEALVAGAGPRPIRYAAALLVFAALAIGNAAYEAGNLAGGALGAAELLGTERKPAVAGLALLAGAALLFGRYRVLERILIALVLLMSLAFAASAVLARPDLGALATGLVPRIPDGGVLAAAALVGTTVVPYNLFLHAAAARERWADASGVAEARADTMVSIGLGGLISILVLTTAAAMLFGTGAEVSNAADMARALEPAAGPLAGALVGLGLLAAGFTSAVTAPLATGYAISEIAPITDDRAKARLQKGVALAVLLIGAATALLDIRPVSLILVAQAANGLLLPVIATVLLLVMNRRDLLGDHANGRLANILGGAVVLFAFALGARALLRVAGVWP